MRLPVFSSQTTLLGTLLLGLLVGCSSDESSSVQQSSGSGAAPRRAAARPARPATRVARPVTARLAGREAASLRALEGARSSPRTLHRRLGFGEPRYDRRRDGGSDRRRDPGGVLLPSRGTTPASFASPQSIRGSVGVGSNKTIVGASGVVFTGHLGLGASSNVILRNLAVVGYNCTDSPSDCSGGQDAISINGGAHHICVDHCSVSDGSDGNLDITDAADYVTIGWTKFFYSSQRPDPANANGHRFSNLIGSSDTATGDTGHLRVTFHHSWWADWSTSGCPARASARSTSSTTLHLGRQFLLRRRGGRGQCPLENNVFLGSITRSTRPATRTPRASPPPSAISGRTRA